MMLLKMLTPDKELKQFNTRFAQSTGLDYVSRILEHFGFSYLVRHAEKERIPASGKVVIVANHPIGTLDGLALLKMVSEIRSDVKIVGEDALTQIAPLSPVLLPMLGRGENHEEMDAIHAHLKAEGALIIFPADDVSRMGLTGIKDGAWSTIFLTIAEHAHAPILPIFVDARNSLMFYALSFLTRPLATFWRLGDTFRHAENALVIRIGELIDPIVHEDLNLPLKTKARLFRKQVYRVAKGKPSLFRTMSPVAHPESRPLLQKEIVRCQILGETRDRKKIYLYRHEQDSAIMREIGRLREEAFRLIGEGTGNRRDIDSYDQYYMHLVLWDEEDMEIVGAYRLCPTHQVLNPDCQHKLYTTTLFDYTPEARTILNSGLELGRSFVQPKYWGSRSLDYLWMGIAALLRANPQYRYLLGGVSISNSMSRTAKDMMVRYYQLYYGANPPIAQCKRPYTIEDNALKRIDTLFDGLDTKQAFIVLKEQLGHLGYSVPTLYKQYTELSNPGGTQFHGFNIDPDFNDCVDGLVVVDIANMTELKKKRFGLTEHKVVEPEILVFDNEL